MQSSDAYTTSMHTDCLLFHQCSRPGPRAASVCFCQCLGWKNMSNRFGRSSASVCSAENTMTHPNIAASSQSAGECGDEDQPGRAQAPDRPVHLLHAQRRRYRQGAFRDVASQAWRTAALTRRTAVFKLGHSSHSALLCPHARPRFFSACFAQRPPPSAPLSGAWAYPLRPQIRCAECPEVENEPKMEYCVECFSVGVEVFPHKARLCGPRVRPRQGRPSRRRPRSGRPPSTAAAPLGRRSPLHH